MMRLLRMLGILLGTLIAGGFGMCGAFGVLSSPHGFIESGFDPVSLVCGLAGLGISAVCFRIVWWLVLKGESGNGAPPAQ